MWRSREDGGVENLEPAGPLADRQRPGSPLALAIAVLSVGAVVAVALSDWQLTTLSRFVSSSVVETGISVLSCEISEPSTR